MRRDKAVAVAAVFTAACALISSKYIGATHTLAKQLIGNFNNNLVEYWLWLSLPALVTAVLLFFALKTAMASRLRAAGLSLAIGAAAEWIGLFGPFLFCVFFTRRVCD